MRGETFFFVLQIFFFKNIKPHDSNSIVCYTTKNSTILFIFSIGKVFLYFKFRNKIKI